MSLFLPTTSSHILTTLTGRRGDSSASPSKTGDTPTGATSHIGRSNRVEQSRDPLCVDAASLSSKMEEYSRLKQQLSVFLPHHLLKESTLPQQLERLHNS